MDLTIIRLILTVLLLQSFVAVATTEVSFQIKNLPVELNIHRKQLLSEPYYSFMNNPQFVYRIGSISKNHIILNYKKNDLYVLMDGEKEISRTTIKREQPEQLGTFIRFQFYRYFLGEEKFSKQIELSQLAPAQKTDYTAKDPKDKLISKKDDPIENSIKATPVEIQNVETPSLLAFDPIEAKIKYEPPKAEDLKLIESFGSSTQEEKKSFLSHIFAETHFPLLFSIGAVFFGPLEPQSDNTNGQKGLELAFGGHFKSGWSFKIFSRDFVARDSFSNPYLEQNLSGVVVMKSIRNDSFYLLAGYANEVLKKVNLGNENQKKFLAGVGVSFYTWLSLEARFEITRSKYSDNFQKDIGSGTSPVVILNFGHYL